MTMKVTELEMAAMMNIAQNEFNNANYGMPDSAEDTACWTNCIADCGGGPVDCPQGKVLSGVLSSLSKKGLVWSHNTGSSEDATGLTESGFKLWKTAIDSFVPEVETSVSVEVITSEAPVEIEAPFTELEVKAVEELSKLDDYDEGHLFTTEDMVTEGITLNQAKGIISSLEKKFVIGDSYHKGDGGCKVWYIGNSEINTVLSHKKVEVPEDPKTVLMNYLIKAGKELRNAVETEKVSDEAVARFIQLKLAKGNLPEAVWNALKK